MRIYSLLILSFLLLASAVLINSAEMPRSEKSLLYSIMQGREDSEEGRCLGPMDECNVFDDNCCAGWLKCNCDWGFAGNCRCSKTPKEG
uniref:U18-hexatoxin-Hi1a n=1 Tax=Hadronyche infensa TaxID=153481 RepID=TI1A_HADIN